MLARATAQDDWNGMLIHSIPILTYTYIFTVLEIVVLLAQTYYISRFVLVVG